MLFFCGNGYVSPHVGGLVPTGLFPEGRSYQDEGVQPWALEGAFASWKT